MKLGYMMGIAATVETVESTFKREREREGERECVWGVDHLPLAADENAPAN